MWKLMYVFFSVSLQAISGKLVGDHICRTEERYPVNVTEFYIRNLTVRNYKWCLNVPPRCSYYTIKKIEGTRVVEKNETRVVEQCCLGYLEMDHFCISTCLTCKHGLCKERTCHCSPGFTGINCDTRCQVGFWGPNCTNICKCNNGVCDPSDGSCTIKNKIEDRYIDTKTYELSSELSSTNYFSETTVIAETTETFLSENDNKVTEWYYGKESTTRKVDPTNYDSNLYFTSTVPSKINVIEHTINSKNNSNMPENLNVKNLTMSVNKTKSSSKGNIRLKSNVINNDVELIIPVGIHYDRISTPLLHEDTTSINQKRTYLSEEITKKNEKSRSEEYYFINSMSVSAVTAAALIFLALAAFTVRKKFKSKQKAESNKSDGVATVAVYTASIFHTPLPDPPACENPSYILPLECQNRLHEPISQIHAVYNPSKMISSEFKPYEYDYPPSSGSYRAASIIDPLDADVNQKPIFTQTEPVYDEIPCRGEYKCIADTHVEDTTSVYMNTCGLAKV